MKTKICILGAFGNPQECSNGQTIKTWTVYNELLKTGKFVISKVDTELKSKHPVVLFILSIYRFIFNKKILVLLSSRGIKFYFPILYVFAKFFGKKIFNCCIGTGPLSYVKQKGKPLQFVNSFVVTWVETQKLKFELEKIGVHNLEVVPNFKNLELVPYKKYQPNNAYYCFVYFSRIIKEKGIEEAISAITSINEREKNVLCALDIYGPVEKSYKENFKELQARFPGFIRYKGIVPYGESTEVLKKYYMLLFPTHWPSEGFPGTIIDAFSSGLPVIASDWNSNAEIVESFKTGIVYPNEKFTTLSEAMVWSIEHRTAIERMRQEVLRSVGKFRPKECISKMLPKLLNE